MWSCGNLNDNGPQKLKYLNSWWNFLGRVKRCGFVGRGISLGADSEVSKTYTIPSMSLCFMAASQDVSSQQLNQCHACTNEIFYLCKLTWPWCFITAIENKQIHFFNLKLSLLSESLWAAMDFLIYDTHSVVYLFRGQDPCCIVTFSRPWLILFYSAFRTLDILHNDITLAEQISEWHSLVH